jgi:predicted RNA binding protein YcfA (HicA-like mRNA interferase family)
MVSEQPTRKMVRLFRDAGWTAGKTVGSHTKWHCGCGSHHFSLPDGHKTISPGVVRKADAAITECKEEN